MITICMTYDLILGSDDPEELQGEPSERGYIFPRLHTRIPQTPEGFTDADGNALRVEIPHGWEGDLVASIRQFPVPTHLWVAHHEVDCGDSEQDFRTGDEVTTTLHVDGATEKEREALIAWAKTGFRKFTPPEEWGEEP